MYPSRPHSLKIKLVGNHTCSSTNLSPWLGPLGDNSQGDFVLSLLIIVLTCTSSKTLPTSSHVPQVRRQPEGYWWLENARGDVAETLEVSPVLRTPSTYWCRGERVARSQDGPRGGEVQDPAISQDFQFFIFLTYTSQSNSP